MKRRSRLAVALAFLAGMVVMVTTHSGASQDVTFGPSDIRLSDDFPGRVFHGDQVVFDGSATTTTEVPSSTTSTNATSTSVAPPAPTTTIVAPTTSSPATTSTQPTGSSACGLAAAAFCETFDSPRNGGTQTGDLDPTLWGVSRVGDFNPGQNIVNGVVASRNACGGSSPPPGDVRVCGGQMVESVNDGGGVVNLDTYPKQPFNFADRTGTVVFDVSADSDGTHAAWPEFLITDEPVPGARRAISGQDPPHAVNSVGFSLDGCLGATGNTSGVGVIFGSVSGAYFEQEGARPNCVTKGSAAAMNHIRVEVSTTHIRVSGTDAGGSTWKVLADEDVALNFTQGLVWLNDAHYNARKSTGEPCECGTQFEHSFTWDNLGFDGPKTYRDLGFDVPYANVSGGTSVHGDRETNLGWAVGAGPAAFTLRGVTWSQTPTKAKVVFNAYSFTDGATVTVSLNGRPAVGKSAGAGFGPRSLAIDLPAGDAAQGANTLTFTSTAPSMVVTNASLILVAAAPVP